MSFWRPNLQWQGFEDALLDHHKKQHRSVWESLVHSGVHLGSQDMNHPGRLQRAKVQRQGTALEWCQQHWEQDDEENQEPQVANENKNNRKANIQRIIDKTDKTIIILYIMIPISAYIYLLTWCWAWIGPGACLCANIPFLFSTGFG